MTGPISVCLSVHVATTSSLRGDRKYIKVHCRSLASLVLLRHPQAWGPKVVKQVPAQQWRHGAATSTHEWGPKAHDSHCRLCSCVLLQGACPDRGQKESIARVDRAHSLHCRGRAPIGDGMITVNVHPVAIVQIAINVPKWRGQKVGERTKSDIWW